VNDLPISYYHRAQYLIEKGRIDEAVKMLNTVLSLDSGHYDSHLLLGGILANSGMYDKAIALWERALRIKPDNSAEIQLLIDEAIKRKKAEADKKESLRTILGYKIKSILIVAVFAAVALVTGIMLPLGPTFRESPPKPHEKALEPVNLKVKVERVFNNNNITGIQVAQRESIIFLSGEVNIVQDKYRLENIIREIDGIDALDLTGIKTLYPRGYYYTVREGDNLWNIAEKTFGNGYKYEELYEINHTRILSPSIISPGMDILIPY